MSQPHEEAAQRPQLFSDAFTAQLGEDLADQIIDQICQAIADSPDEPPQPTSLCLELIVFGLDEDILCELVQCVFTQMNPILLANEIIRTMKRIRRMLKRHTRPTEASRGNSSAKTAAPSAPKTSQPKTTAQHTPNKSQAGTMKTPQAKTSSHSAPDTKESGLTICKFDLIRMIVTQMEALQKRLTDTRHVKDRILEEILLYPTCLSPDLLNDITAVTNHVIIETFRQGLIDQYDNFALKNCNKVSCINSDLEFIAEQIKQLTINIPAGELGIIELADAAAVVAEAFHSEEHDFEEIYDAADAVAEIIKDLAKFYKVKLSQLEELLDNASSGCPVPIEARSTLPTIPEVAQTPAIFPIVSLGGLGQGT